MKSPRNWFIYIFGTFLVCALLAGVVFVYVSYAANEAAPTRPLVFINATIPDNVGIVGQPLVVFGQASDSSGIVQVELWVNGQHVATQANPAQTNRLPFETSQTWIPSGAGNYLILLKAINGAGFLGESDPLVIEVQERGFVPDTSINGEYLVQEGDTLESIASLFGTTPEDLLARNPGLGELTPGTTVLVPPRPVEESSGDGTAPPEIAGEDIPVVDPPAPTPPPGGETEAEPATDPLWEILPLPDGFACLINPEICARASDLEAPPFPAPSGVGFASGEGCSLDVSWTDNSENEDGFRIYRFVSRPRFRLDLLEIVSAVEGSGTRLHYLDTNPPRGSFFYAVVAFNAGGDTWSGPSANVESEGCPSSEPIESQALVVEGLEMSVAGSFDRLYCYASLADSPFERIPAGASNFISLDAGSWNIAEHFSGVNKREVLVPSVGPLNIVVECLGWQGEELINLGRFVRSHPPTDWDGRALIAGPDTGGFNLTYRIQYSFEAIDEAGRSTWPLIDSSLPVPYDLRLATFRTDGPCIEIPGGERCRTIEEPSLVWSYVSAEGLSGGGAIAYKVYRRLSEESLPTLYHTSDDPIPYRSAPLARLDCHETVFYSVSVVVGIDPVTGEEIQSMLSEELEVPPTCGSLEITLETLWVYGVDDGDPCTVFDDCHNDYEAYGWFEFNGHRIRWNDHCDPGFLSGCIYVSPSYSTLPEASGHNWSAFMLNTGDGWRRSNNIIHIPISDGESVDFRFTLLDHDSGSPDERWCGGTGRVLVSIPARPVTEWQSFDQMFETDDGNCIIGFRVRGIP